jgi:hypothetical protein
MTDSQQQPFEQQPTRNKGGAPRGSRNALRHGLRCGALPRGCRRIESETRQLRRSLEDAVIAARGAISVVDAATISRATRWAIHERLAARWLALKADELTPEQLLAFSNQAVRGATERDRAIADLDIDSKPLPSLLPLLEGIG